MNYLDQKPRPPTRSGTRQVWTLIAALSIFIIDSATGVDEVFAVLYVCVVLAAMRSGRKSDVFVAGWGSIGLTALSFCAFVWITPTHSFATACVNCSVSVVAIALVTFLSLKHIESQNDIRRARDHIARVARGISMKEISTTIVHEVTQPLTAIGANANAAQRWLVQTPPNLIEAAGATRRIAQEVERTSEVIRHLRALVEPGEISVQACDVLGLMNEAVEHLRSEIDDSNIDVTVQSLPGLIVMMDGVLIKQVMMNVLANAVDSLQATNRGKRTMVVSTRLEDAMLTMAVRDSGIGGDQATVERMFDPFFTTKPGSGMGIGLSVCKSILDAHGGSIRAFPNQPHGLVVEMRLPALGHHS